VILAGAMAAFKGWPVVVAYLGRRVDYTEPLFVTVVMALASTRPILRLAEGSLSLLASAGGQTIAAWWLSILIIGPLLGSLITEPGAMTISALLLARQFYHYEPSLRLRYATIGLLFVNVSVGGTLSNFAAPPMIMAAGPWNWSAADVLTNFGWRAAVGIVVSTLLVFGVFWREFGALERTRMAKGRFQTIGGGAHIPVWIIAVQTAFVAYTVAVSRYVPLFVGGFLFFLAFAQATAHHQKRLDLRSPLLVGFFLAGLVVHGGLQSWWLQPVLQSLGRMTLFWGATALTAFNDNAAITYLATLVPHLTDALKHAVVAGAVTGGGLTVIANAPNPAGQSLLQRFFPGGVSPWRLAVAAAGPTLVMAAAFMLFSS
ncbi:MAG: putative Na+/H+ antiporter, partial [Opitutaceae bacterium]